LTIPPHGPRSLFFFSPRLWRGNRGRKLQRPHLCSKPSSTKIYPISLPPLPLLLTPAALIGMIGRNRGRKKHDCCAPIGLQPGRPPPPPPSPSPPSPSFPLPPPNRYKIPTKPADSRADDAPSHILFFFFGLPLRPQAAPRLDNNATSTCSAFPGPIAGSPTESSLSLPPLSLLSLGRAAARGNEARRSMLLFVRPDQDPPPLSPHFPLPRRGVETTRRSSATDSSSTVVAADLKFPLPPPFSSFPRGLPYEGHIRAQARPSEPCPS